MRQQTTTVAGDTVAIRLVESAADAVEAEAWARSQRLLAFDTETGGPEPLNQWHPEFRVRLAQFGNASVTYVLPIERATEIRAAAQNMLTAAHLLAHNAPFDIIGALRSDLCATPMELITRTVDTSILSKLIDPRAAGNGAVGNRLKDLAQHWIDPNAADGQAALNARFHELGFTNDTGWDGIPWDDPVYWLYAGLDVILTSRLFPPLLAELKSMPSYGLLQFEREVQAEVMRVEIKGALIDQPYSAGLSAELDTEHREQLAIVHSFGIEKAGNPAKVAAKLLAMGEEIPERTDGGAVAAGKEVLARLADVNVRDWDEPLNTRAPNPLAVSVMRAKRASKWKVTYADPMRSRVDEVGRLHAKFNSLQARTSRMSVASPPLQQIPASDKRIRRMVVAAPGHLLVAADYAAVELRLLAALANIQIIKEVIASGEDLHNRTGKMIFGDDFADRVRQGDPWAVKQRTVIKVATYGTVYGGGGRAISQQTGIPMDEAQTLNKSLHAVYPEIKRYSNALQREAMLSADHRIVTATGRCLPVDRDRSYSALNYSVQSVARDVFADAMLRLRDAGMADTVILIVHDEVILEVPTEAAPDSAAQLAKIMTTEVLGVPIEAEGKVLGAHWTK